MMPVPGFDLRPQLIERKVRLEAVIPTLGEPSEAVRLLKEVDAALKRMDEGWYGVCESCRGPIERERLLVDPLVRVCLGCLSGAQQKSLEEDLDLASRIQAALLPQKSLQCCGWETSYHYEPAGPVSGDYCDVLSTGPDRDTLMFILGDVSGKGLSASLLVSHLHAVFHSLVNFQFPVEALMSRANHVLCESALPTHYATLICGLADSSGNVQLCNAGHPSALLARGDRVIELAATGLPLGLFCDGHYTVHEMKLEPGDTLFLYSDGFYEATYNGAQFGFDRVRDLIVRHGRNGGKELLNCCTQSLSTFMNGATLADDLSLMAVQRMKT